ncbi:hypothetical protein J7293_02521 [Nakaseomyces glabratus]|nr:hypothetical protein J7293_02521 [Nakaseomyces glabratus]
MRFKSIFSSAALISCWAFGVAKLYQNQEIIIDSATLGSQIFEDDELMQLLNAKVTLNNFTDIRLPQGISLNSRSVLKINAPPGHGKPYSLVINGQVTIGKDSKFIFDGSSLEYESQSAASSNFKFDINTGSKGVFIFTYCTMTIKLPKLSEGLIDSDSVAAIHIGGTFEAPNINSPLSILGTLEVLTSETTVDGSFDDKLWRVDLGPDQIVEDGEGYRYILTGNIHCQAYVSVYADIFKATKTVLHALGYRGYTVVSPMTIDLSEGPVFSGGLYLYYIVLPEGQDGLTFLNFAVHEDKGIPAPTLGFMFLYSGDQTDVVATANQNIINVMNLNSKKSISVIGDHNYNITTKYSDGKSIQQQGYSGVQSYPNELIVYLYAPPSEEPDYTTTIDKGNGEFETDVVSHITTKDSDGKPTTIVTTIPWKPSEEADYTTTIDKGNGEFETDVVSHITTKDSDGKPTTIVTTIPWKPSEEADYTTTIDKGNGEFETDVVSHITTKDSDGKPTTIVTTIPLKPSDAGEADYTTTITSDGHTITEVVSHITTTDSDGNTVTYTTMMASFDQVGDGVYTSAPPYSQPPVVTTTVTEDDGSSKTVVISYSPSEGEDGVTRTGTTTISTITPSGEADYTTTIDKGNGDFETDLVSHITTKDSDGKPTTITTIPLKPSDAGEADYTTTITSDGHTITEVVSHITTTDSDGNTVTYTTTMASFDQVGDGVYTSAPPYSQPPVVTTTVTEDDGSSKTVVISYSPSEGEDGVTRTGTTTISTITPSGEADYTTTIDKGNGDFETDLVSHITTKDSNGNPTTIVTTIPLKPSDAGEADYTTTITSDGHTITEVVSHITTTDSDGNTVTYTTTMASFDQVGDGVYTSAPPYSQPPVVTTTVTEDDGSSKTVVISYSPSEGEDGVTRTGTTTISTITPSGEADYTTTIDKGNGDFETDLVSHITTKDSNGNPTTIVTTIPLKPSDAGEADYTTTITSDGHTITEVVSHITTTDSDGNTVTYTTTMASFDQVGDGVYTSAPPYSQPPVVTTTVTEDDGSSKTVVISYSPSEGEDGVTRTGTTTISTITPSGEADYTTTIDKGNGDFETDLVSHITTTDSDGKPTTIITTVTLIEEPDYTSVFVSDGHTITAVVSHVTTTNDIGQTVTTTVTVMSYDQVGEGVYTSAPAYAQPPVTTTTVSANTATATVVISYFPSIGDDGVTGTGTTTVSTVSVGGEVDYTTTVDRGNGSTETDVISHITTTDSNGNPTTITTTITNAPPPLNSKANIGSDYTSTVVSNGHTIVSTVTQTVGGQSHGNTVSSAAPVTTVSGASFNAPETAGVGGIVNSQNSQSQYVADQGSGNEKPTQAPGTAGGSGSGSVHQSAGNIVPSGSPSVQSPMNTASPVNGIHSSQTPHSVPSQAQQQGQGQAQAPSSRQQAATTVLSPSGSSVNNIGSGFNSTQTASVLQGKGASIKVTSISILFSIITVIVVGMI